MRQGFVLERKYLRCLLRRYAAPESGGYGWVGVASGPGRRLVALACVDKLITYGGAAALLRLGAHNVTYKQTPLSNHNTLTK